jgi:hypothetical protein
LSVAVAATFCVVDDVAPTAVKPAFAAPAAIVTEAGTVRAELLAETAIGIPPAGAGAEMATVQLEDAPAANVVGLQTSEERTA